MFLFVIMFDSILYEMQFIGPRNTMEIFRGKF